MAHSNGWTGAKHRPHPRASVIQRRIVRSFPSRSFGRHWLIGSVCHDCHVTLGPSYPTLHNGWPPCPAFLNCPRELQSEVSVPIAPHAHPLNPPPLVVRLEGYLLCGRDLVIVKIHRDSKNNPLYSAPDVVLGGLFQLLQDERPLSRVANTIGWHRTRCYTRRQVFNTSDAATTGPAWPTLPCAAF